MVFKKSIVKDRDNKQEDKTMTFKQAHKMAMNKSAAFRKQDALVRQAMETGGQTACLTFTIEGETFYYGFDGVDLQAGKYSKHRAAALVERDESLIIL